VAIAQWTTTPDPENVARLRREIRDYAVGHGLAPHRVEALTLAVSEIVSNAVVHAFRDGSRGTITVAAGFQGDAMVVRVVDDGVGLSPRADSPGAGLGLVIAGSIADGLHVELPDRGGTEVCLTFAAAA